MSKILESCSVCGSEFEVQFRYQMEERDGGFAFFCSQECLKKSQVAGHDGSVTCDACAKRFQPQLVSQVLYIGGRRHYACSQQCRSQLLDEANGKRLGDMDSSEPARTPAVPVGQVAASPRAPSAVGPDHRNRPAPAIPARQPTPSPSVSGASGPAQPVSLSPTVVGNSARRQQPGHQGAPRRSRSGPVVFAVFNHKGGTGKTTTSVSVAAGLAEQGKRVLLVDTDAQGNVAVSLDRKADKSLYHVMVMGLPLKSITQPVRNNLDLVASNETLAAAELYLAGRQNRDRILRDKLAPYVSDYDYVVLDCSPSLSLMNQNALVFADNVLVPVACDYLSLVGVRQVIKTIRNVNRLLHHPVQLWGVVPTFYDARANICRDAVQTLQQHFGERCLPPIRSAIKVKEAPAHGKTIFEYAATSTAAEDYRVVVSKMLHAPRAMQRPPQRRAAVSA